MSKNVKGLTYQQKVNRVLELIKEQTIPFKLEIWQTAEDREQGYGSTYLISDQMPTTNSADFKNIITRAKKLFEINNLACVEIIYGNDDQTIWHIDEDSNEPEIGDFELEQFEQFMEDLRIGKKSFEEEFEDNIMSYATGDDSPVYDFQMDFSPAKKTKKSLSKNKSKK